MPGLINRFPRGLLGLLDAKTGGKTPQAIADMVIPQLDIERYYLAQFSEAIIDTSGAVAGVGSIFGASFLLDCPNDEIWIVSHYAVLSSIALAAGETLGLVPSIRFRTNAGGTVDVDLAAALTVGQGPLLWSRCTANRSFVMGPGDRLGAFIYNRVVYAGLVLFQAQVNKIKI